MKQDVKPIQETKRLLGIDAARGFAIFGILMVNIGAFSAPYFIYGNPNKVWTSTVDTFILAGIDMFFQASFYTLFSILFGFGLGMMKERIKKRGGNVHAFLTRRMILLLGIGIIHAFLLWHGDILFSYALVGLLSLVFIQRNHQLKIKLGVFLLGGSVSLITFLYYLSRDYLNYVDQVAIKQSFQHYLSGDIQTIWMQNYRDWLFANSPINLIFLLFILLPFFLFGMVLAEKRWLHEPEKYKNNLFKLGLVSFIFFVALKIGPYLFGNPLWFSFLQDNIGGLFSALFYIISITWISGKQLGQRLLMPFAYVGRMALTNYIVQSLICFILSYGVGFGLYGSITPTIGVLVAVIIYICQMLVSKWWFKRYRFGPLEWIWRCLTYGKIQPFKK